MNEIAINLRLPKSLHRQIKLKALKNVRSVNGEIIVALRRYLNLPVDTLTVEGTEAPNEPQP